MTTPATAVSTTTLRALVLDDDPFMLDLMPEMLAQLGPFEVRVESDGRRALLALAEQGPDLLVCDLSMPDMDGIEFMHAAACAGFAGSVLLVSGMDSGVRMAADHLARAHGLRVIGTFKKPITLEQLKRALAPLLKGKTGKNENSHNLTPFFGK